MNEFKEKLIDYIYDVLIPFGDEWHWDNAAIKDYIINLVNIINGDNNEN